MKGLRDNKQRGIANGKPWMFLMFLLFLTVKWWIMFIFASLKWYFEMFGLL